MSDTNLLTVTINADFLMFAIAILSAAWVLVKIGEGIESLCWKFADVRRRKTQEKERADIPIHKDPYPTIWGMPEMPKRFHKVY